MLVLLSLCSLAFALPGATTDPKGIAEALPETCGMVVTAQMPADEFIAALGAARLQSLAARCGLSVSQLSGSMDGRGFLAVYEGDTVIALGVKAPLPQLSGAGTQAVTQDLRVEQSWLLLGDSTTIDLFLDESDTLSNAVRFTRVADHWPGGRVLFYSGALLKPSKRWRYQINQNRGLMAGLYDALNSVPPSPQVCAGMAGSQLEAWVAPLSTKTSAGQTWSSTLRGNKVVRQWVPGFFQECLKLREVLEAFDDMNRSLPLEWQLYADAERAIESAQSSGYSLAKALVPVLTGQRLDPTPFQETLQSQGNGLWVYRLDPGQTAELAGVLQQTLAP